MYPSHKLQQSLLSRRLLIYVVICSLFFSMITTFVQVAIRHRNNLLAIDNTFKFIKESYVDSIAASVFALDEEQLRLELKGVLNFPHIEYVQVVETRGGQQIRFEEGAPQLSHDMVRIFDLKYGPPSKEQSSYGQLTVAANLNKIYGQLWENGIVAFTLNALGLGIVALCIFVIFQNVLTRHLIAMCAYTNNLSLNQLDRTFKLDRKSPVLWRDDELNQLSTALNKLCNRLKYGLHEIKIREAELQANAESLRRYELIISSTNDMMSFVDDQYIYRSVNDAYLVAHAKKREDIVGKSVENLMGIQSFQKIAKGYLDQGLSGEHVQYQSWFTYAGIGRRYMDVTYHPYKDHQGDVSGVVVTVHDLTEQKQADEAIASFFDQSLVMLYVVDMETTNLVRVNKEVVRITGRAEQNLTGTPLREIVHPDDQETTMKTMAKLAEGKPVTGYQNRHLTVDGDVRYFEWNAVPDMEHELIYAMARDVTDQKKVETEREKLQAQLLQAKKMESVGRLAGGVAHDFNNMLSIILGHTEMILDDYKSDRSLTEMVQEIYTAARRSADFTRQLLAFARKQTIVPKVLNLNETLEGMLKMLRRLIGEEIDLAWLPKTDLWSVKIDPSQVSQVLANLCANARDSIDGVGKVTIETDNVVFGETYCQNHQGCIPGQYAMIAISDDGCGIKKENLPKLFEPFFTTKDIGEGTGLGLATVYGVIKQNLGFINVYSEIDKGTTFKIYLPMYSDQPLQPVLEMAAPIAATGQETILLVEDEEAIIKVTASMLERLGYKLISTTSAIEAIQIVESRTDKIDLLLTDVVMPGMSGRDLSKKLTTIHPNLKCLFMSGYTADVIAHHGVLDTGVQFIHKPFSNLDLASKVRQVLDEAPVIPV